MRSAEATQGAGRLTRFRPTLPKWSAASKRAGTGVRAIPVEPGSYATAINIHNPHAKPVVFLKKAVLLFDLDSKEVGRLFEPPKPPSPLHRGELLPDWGMEVDCRDIRQELLSGQASPAPVFITGWVIIESPDPLDVVAVYTVRGAW